jgi:uncharacterized protein YndB with AHSA1/START domain
MSRQRVAVERAFPFPVEKLFEHLSEHENLAPLLGASITRVRDGDAERNGVGSVRRIRVGPGAPFEETVTVFEPNRRIEYRITRGSPLKNHHGCMVFSGDGDGSRLHYAIEFEGRFPLIAPLVRLILQRSIERGLSRLAL